MTDPISDMLTRIRNACLVQRKQVVVPASRIKEGIAKILSEEGFIQGYTVVEDTPQANIVISLKYIGRGVPVINGLERISKPGRRIYAGYQEIPWVRSGLGINILSTPQGLMTGRKARRAKIGGEILCNVW
jgi:small subunit ribosomal protein S8